MMQKTLINTQGIIEALAISAKLKTVGKPRKQLAIGEEFT